MMIWVMSLVIIADDKRFFFERNSSNMMKILMFIHRNYFLLDFRKGLWVFEKMRYLGGDWKISTQLTMIVFNQRLFHMPPGFESRTNSGLSDLLTYQNREIVPPLLLREQNSHAPMIFPSSNCTTPGFTQQRFHTFLREFSNSPQFSLYFGWL